MNRPTAMYAPTPQLPASIPQSQLIQTLLNLASPGTARYQGHMLRPDGVYRVVVLVANRYQLISIPASALLLTELGILIESDRYAILQQLNPDFSIAIPPQTADQFLTN